MPNFKPALLALLASSVAAPALAEYPDRPVSFVVPFPPGDLEDVLTRMIAEDFQAKYGVAAAVVNKPSEGGPFPGAAEVAAAPADGYTIGSFVVDIPVVGPEVGVPGLNPAPFEPLGIFLTYPFVIATSADKPYSTMTELAEHSQSEPQLLGHFGAFLLPTQATFAAAKETMASARAQELAAQTGAIVYWMDAEEAKARIASDIEVSGRIAGMLEQ